MMTRINMDAPMGVGLGAALSNAGRMASERGKGGVSIVLATYNGAEFIGDQVESLLRQSEPPLEIIVSDDASTDRTIEIITEITRDCTIPIHISVNAKRLGFRDNFLRAAERASGDYLAFCDQDDVWNSNKLKVCSKYFRDSSISMVAHSATLIDKHSRTIGDFPQGIRCTQVRGPLSYDPWMTFFGFTMIFRRELLSLLSINDRFIDYIVPGEPISHDRWIMFLAQMVGSTVEVCEPLVAYRQHERNVFGAKSPARRVRDVKASSERYIEATAQMLEIIGKITDDVQSVFPQFDRRRCIDFLERAVKQLTLRSTVYEAGSTLRGAAGVARCMSAGGYRAVHDGKMRWRSVARDLEFVLLGR